MPIVIHKIVKTDWADELKLTSELKKNGNNTKYFNQ